MHVVFTTVVCLILAQGLSTEPRLHRYSCSLCATSFPSALILCLYVFHIPNIQRSIKVLDISRIIADSSCSVLSRGHWPRSGALRFGVRARAGHRVAVRVACSLDERFSLACVAFASRKGKSHSSWHFSWGLFREAPVINYYVDDHSEC